MENTTTEWLTLKEAMSHLKIKSRNSLTKYCLKYNVRVVKPMGKVYYHRADLIATMASNAFKMGL